MSKEEMEKLYSESIAFRTYVDRECAMYNMTKEQAFEILIVQEYAKYIIAEGRTQ